MSADPTPSEQTDAAPGASGEAPSVPPDAGDTTGATDDRGGVPTMSGTYPRSDGTAEPDGPGGGAPESDASETPAPADDDEIRDRLVSDPGGYRSRWENIQAGFVDEPRRSVADADALVGEVIDQITAAFASARADLEKEWSRGDEVSTEDLRQAFRRYRSLFQRLLTT